MALKDWIKQEVGNIGHTENIIWWQKKGTTHDDRLELFSTKIIEFTPIRKEFQIWVVEKNTLGQKKFKTKAQAITYAKSYMRRN